MRLYTQQPSNMDSSLESLLKSRPAGPEPNHSRPQCLIVHASGTPSCVVYGEVVPAENEGEAPMLLPMGFIPSNACFLQSRLDARINEMKSMRLASTLAEANNSGNNPRPMGMAMESNAVKAKAPVMPHLKTCRRPRHPLQQPRKSIY